MNWFLYFVILFTQSTCAIRILSTATTSAICEMEAMYGSPEYLESIRQISNQLVNVETGYEGIHIYLILPIHIGCQLSELELVVVTEGNVSDDEFFDLTDDVKNNIDDDLEIKLYIVENLVEIPAQIRPRVIHIHPRLQVNQVGSSDARELEIRLILESIAQELHLRITNIRFNTREISVTLADLEGSDGANNSRVLRNRFILMARARTRRIVRAI